MTPERLKEIERMLEIEETASPDTEEWSAGWIRELLDEVGREP